MERGLYIAASGMIAEQMRQDQLANELANSSTPGYKPDRITQRSFPELLLSNSQTGQTIGPLGTGAFADSMTTDLTAQPLRTTNEPLDFAIAGTGFFGVQTPQGVRYTRDGQFGVSANGTLQDAQGNQVIGQGGQPVRVVDGRADPRQLAVFRANNARKQGDDLFTGAAAGNDTGVVKSGALEGSGVDPTTVMVDMMTSFRAYQAGQKSIQTIDATLQRTANEVGSLSGS